MPLLRGRLTIRNSAEPDNSTAEETGRARNPVRWLLVCALAIPLIVLNCGWIANSEMKTGVTEITISSLFMCVTFILFILTLLNLVVRRVAGPNAALNQAELMALYAMLSVSGVVAGVGHFGFFTPFLTNPWYYGSSSRKEWQDFWSMLPPSIGPRQPEVLKHFYSGNSTFFQPYIMRAWAGPLLVWSLFFLVLLWTTLCIVAVLRRRWADEEHLPFPVIQLPLEMTREGAPLYRNRLLWIGFALPAALHSLNSLHTLYPTLPSFAINSIHDIVPEWNLPMPLTGFGTLYYALHPAGVGFGYLVNLDVSFSLWFFYLLRKAVDVWAVTVGWRDGSAGADADDHFPFYIGQAGGAWMLLGIAALWSGRYYIRAYIHRALHGDPEGVDRGESMSARTAVFGAAGGFLAMCAFTCRWGGAWWVTPAFLLVYLLLMVSLSRVRAELAVVSSELTWVTPQSILPSITGTSTLSRVDLTHWGILSWFNTDYRAEGMPHELESLVGMERSRGKLHPLVWAIMLAAAVSIVSAALWDLQMYYVNGAATAHVNDWRISKGSEPWDDLQRWFNDPKPPDAHAMAAMAFGMFAVSTLTALRSRFVGFPLHPAAYALNVSFANDFFWCDMFVAWALKALILRYGGMKLYRQAMPFFLGLILGDFITGSVWSIIGTLMHIEIFRTFAT